MRWLLGCVAAVGVSVALVACAPATCSGCSGCCDQGVCLSGNAPGACGRSGQACVACGAGRTCDLGECVAAPDAGPVDANRPKLCGCVQGCCAADGGCSPGNLASACGGSGRFCTTCEPGFVCPLGTCTSSGGCTGCIDALGLCRPGIETLACGSGGGLCRACVGTDVCLAGQCVGTSTCSAGNCPAGCCASTNICVPASSDHCGTMGSACVTCPDAGSCVAGTCQ